MAYYNSAFKNDDEENQQQMTQPVTGQQGPIQRTSDTTGMIAPTTPAGMAGSLQSGGPTRSPNRFVNMSRFLEANPMMDTAKAVGNIEQGIDKGEQDKFNQATQGTQNFINSGGTYTAPTGSRSDYENFIWNLIPSNNGTNQGGPKVKSAERPEPSEIGPKQQGYNLNLLKDYLTLNNIPGNANWAASNEASQKMEMLKNPNKIGPNSLARQLVGNQSTNYGAGMEALDSAMFNQSPEVQSAIDAAQKAYQQNNSDRLAKLNSLNSTLQGYRDNDRTQKNWAKSFLDQKYNEGLGKTFKDEKDPELYKYRQLASVLGYDPNAFKVVPPTPAEIEDQKNQAEAEAQDKRDEKAWKNTPAGVKRKKADLEQWQSGRFG